MITTTAPTTWQELQKQAALILTECGFEVEIEKVVTLVRGKAEIDVYAEETVQGRTYKILCECKLWKSAVPQDVVHAFRTVTADVGANKGYIISQNGFQSGAYAAAGLTNLELVTWEQFQDAFEQSWLANYFSPYITKKLDPLLTFSEPFAPSWFPELPKQDKAEFLALKDENDLLGVFVMSLTIYPRKLRSQEYPKLPLRSLPDPDGRFSTFSAEIMDARGYRELLESLVRTGEGIIRQYRAIRDRNSKTGRE